MVIDPDVASVVGDGGAQGFVAHDRTVHLLGRQAAKKISDILVGQCQASVTVLPITSSVSAEDDAIAEPQPKVWNFAARMISVSGSTLSIRRNASPHEIAPTSPMPLASARTSAFLGYRNIP